MILSAPRHPRSYKKRVCARLLQNVYQNVCMRADGARQRRRTEKPHDLELAYAQPTTLTNSSWYEIVHKHDNARAHLHWIALSALSSAAVELCCFLAVRAHGGLVSRFLVLPGRMLL